MTILNPNFDPEDKMKFVTGWGKITSGQSDYKRPKGVWLFTNSKTGNSAWYKIDSNGEISSSSIVMQK